MFGRKKAADDNSVYATMIKALDKAQLKYERHDDKRAVTFTMQGDDLPIATLMAVDSSAITFRCMLAFEAPEERYPEVMFSLNAINDELKFGSFRLDTENGHVNFNYGYIFADANPSGDLILSILKMVVDTVDAHDGDLKKIATVVTPYTGHDPMFG